MRVDSKRIYSSWSVSKYERTLIYGRFVRVLIMYDGSWANKERVPICNFNRGTRRLGGTALITPGPTGDSRSTTGVNP